MTDIIELVKQLLLTEYKQFIYEDKLKSITPYVNGKIHGEVKYFNNGKLSIIQEYVDGIDTGYIKFFFKNGNLSRTIKLNKGVKQGVETIYYRDGRVRTINFWENGKIVKKIKGEKNNEKN